MVITSSIMDVISSPFKRRLVHHCACIASTLRGWVQALLSEPHADAINGDFSTGYRISGGFPTNIGIVRCTVSVATIVVVGAGVDI